MPPEISPYFTELAERMGRIEDKVAGIPEIAGKVDRMDVKVERVRIFVEGVDGDNGLKKDVAGLKKDVSDIKQYRSDENAVRKSKAGFWTPWKTMLFSVIGSLIVLLITLALTGVLPNG